MPFNPSDAFFTCPAQGGSGQNLVTKGDNAVCNQLLQVQKRNEELLQYYFHDSTLDLPKLQALEQQYFDPQANNVAMTVNALTDDNGNDYLQNLGVTVSNTSEITVPQVDYLRDISLFGQFVFYIVLFYIIVLTMHRLVTKWF